MLLMENDKKSRTQDRHRPASVVRVSPELEGPARYLCTLRVQKLTQVVNDILRRELEREGLWPITDEVRAKLKDADLLEEG